MILSTIFNEFLNEKFRANKAFKQYINMCVLAEDPRRFDIQNRWRDSIYKGKRSVSAGTLLLIDNNNNYQLKRVSNTGGYSECNFINFLDNNLIIGNIIGDYNKYIELSLNKLYWIPTQTNIQNILINSENFNYKNSIFKSFNEWVSKDSDYKEIFKSISSLWLAFYMLKFNKKWVKNNKYWNWEEFY